jgi:Bifunctional DNA primase/polymerase, N-terminal
VSTELHEAALDYVTRLKWPVFPISPGDKKPPLTSHGYLDATTDVEQIEAWWRKNPQANIATPTGVVFDVIDVEAGHLKLFLETLDPTAYARVRTPSGGLHLYVAVTGRRCQRLWFGDFKGKGGYVLLPPSRIKDAIYKGLD